MDSGKIKRLCRQLESQIDSLDGQNGPDQVASAAAMGSALIRVASESPIEDVDSAAFGAVYACFLGLVEDAKAFFAGAAGEYAAVAGTARFQDAIKQVEEGRGACEELRHQIAQVREESRSLCAASQRLRAELETSRQGLLEAKGEHDELTARTAECNPEIVAARRDANGRLAADLAKATAELRALEEEREANAAQLGQVNEQIAALPSENQALLESYKAKVEHLCELESAQEACGPEAQAEVEGKIDHLRPEVEKLATAMQILKERLKDLEDQHLDYDRERQTLETDILERVGSALGDLERVTTEHENELAEAGRRARQLEERMAECIEARRRYRDWLDADVSPLECMIAALDRPEAQALRETMDVGTLQEVRALHEKAEESLMRLDEIIAVCVESAHLDRAALERRVRR